MDFNKIFVDAKESSVHSMSIHLINNVLNDDEKTVKEKFESIEDIVVNASEHLDSQF